MGDVEGVYSLVEVGQVPAGLVQQVRTPGEHGETPEPCVEAVDYAGKECHPVVDYFVLQPPSIDVRDACTSLFESQPDKGNCP